jgi:hypothetical protein
MAAYTAILDRTGAFAVAIRHLDEVQIPGGFNTDAEAQAWMVERRAKDAKRA